MIESNVLKNELPEECNVSLSHALTHLESAIDDPEDKEQVLHDVWMTVRILIEYHNKLESE